MTERAGDGFAGRWILRVSVAEAAGFAVAATAGASLAFAAAPASVAYPVAIAAGAVEGLALGAGQYSAMRSRRPPLVAWLGATSGGAAFAWAIGMLPSTIGVDLASPATCVVMAVGAVLLLASIPVGLYVVAGLLMAVTVAAVTAPLARRLFGR